MRELAEISKQLEKQADKELSMTNPDARSMATRERRSGIVDYNVQAAVDTFQRRTAMRHDSAKSKIVGIFKDADAGPKPAELCRKQRIS